MRIFSRLAGWVGTGARAFVALIGIAGITVALANYTMTQGSGTTFGSIVVSTVHYAQQLLCDPTTPTQCAAVSASGALTIQGPSSAALATKANQDTNSATTAHTCSTAGTSIIGCLGQIDDDVKGSIPAGTNIIGKVGIDQTTPGTTNGVQVNAISPNVTPTDCSGTITTGGTAQNAFTAGATKHGFTILNLDTTEPMWISFTTTAAASTVASYPLQAATATTFAGTGSFTSPTGFGMNTALSVIAATTGHKWSCTWW